MLCQRPVKTFLGSSFLAAVLLLRNYREYTPKVEFDVTFLSLMYPNWLTHIIEYS